MLEIFAVGVATLWDTVLNIIKIGVPLLGLALQCISLSVAYINLSRKNCQYSWRECYLDYDFVITRAAVCLLLCIMNEGVYVSECGGQNLSEDKDWSLDFDSSLV
jgi:hypothetical protein